MEKDMSFKLVTVAASIATAIGLSACAPVHGEAVNRYEVMTPYVGPSAPALHTALEPAAQQQQAGGFASYANTHLNHLQRAREINALYHEAEWAEGIEWGEAGFHLLFTSSLDPDVLGRGFPSTSDRVVRDWHFWQAEAKYAMGYRRIEQKAGINATSAWVTLERFVVPQMFFNYRAELDASTGNYSLVADVDSRRIDALRAMLGNKEEYGDGFYRDWFGVLRRPEHEPVDMRIVLVADNEAYLPLNITEFVEEFDASGGAIYSVIVATDLTQPEANELISRIGV